MVGRHRQQSWMDNIIDNNRGWIILDIDRFNIDVEEYASKHVT